MDSGAWCLEGCTVVKVVITGDRHWKDRFAIARAFDIVRATHVVEGECSGADLLARAEAESRGLTVSKFPADWANLGRAAGPVRNAVMLDQNPDVVLAFHDNLMGSKGTKNCVLRALERGLDVILISHGATNLSVRRLTVADITRLKRR